MSTPTQRRHPDLQGKPVLVKLGNDIIAAGLLLSYSDMGEVIILGADDDVHYCWPGLSIEPAHDPDVIRGIERVTGERYERGEWRTVRTACDHPLDGHTTHGPWCGTSSQG